VSEGRASGASVSRLRGADLDAAWGIRSTPAERESSRDALLRRCRMFALRMPPAAVFSHSTAALLMGAPLPLREELAPELHIAVPPPHRAPHARGIRGHRLSLVSGDIRECNGLRQTTPARTWCDLATQLELLDLVAVGDFLLHGLYPLATRDELAVMVARFKGRRGCALLAEALPLLDGRAESPPESHLRVILVRAGLPPSRINHEIVMTDGGTDVRTDLHYDAANVHVEYQGDYHRSRHQWRGDMTRRTRLEARGGHVLEINADDLRDPGELVDRVRMLLHRRSGAEQ
jgi:hypothetical protein